MKAARSEHGIGGISNTIRVSSFALCAGLLLAALSSPASAAVLKVGDTLTAGVDTVSYVDPQFKTTHVVSSHGLIGSPADIVSLPGGEILLTSASNNAVLRIDALDGSQQVVSTGGLLSGPRGLAVEANGQLLVTNVDPGSQLASVLRVDPVSGAQSIVALAGLITDPGEIAINTLGQAFVLNVSNIGQPQILEVNPANGATSVVASGNFLNATLTGLDIDDSGNLIISRSDGVVSVNPVSAIQSLVTSGGFINSLSDLTIDIYDDLIVSDFAGESVLRIDETNGAQQVEASGGIHSTAPPMALAAVLEPSLPGDVDRDGVVNVVDLALAGNQWGTPGTAGSAPSADLTHDGVVGVTDLGIIAANWGATLWGTGGPAVAADLVVPAPAAAWIAVFGIGALLRRPRRK